MAIVALHSAATGLGALSTQIDVIANNLANINNDGFKASRVNFEDLMYQQLAQPGVENANGDERPTGIHVGLGTRISGTDHDFRQGGVRQTDRPLDFMIKGEGFFRVKILDDQSPDGFGYTRSGNFFINSEGDLVLGTSFGPRLEPNIRVPDDAIRQSISITSDGRIFAEIPGQGQEELGQLELTTFVNPRGLSPIGGNIFIETEASGQPITGDPGEDGRGEVINNHLEGSNVNPVTELVDLIKAQRYFEMNSQSIQAADQALQVVANLRRF
ncbi:MAG: flagellar basal-body rod protein FlgG [Phycisphaeraceae bacterium]|nr:flagellar basal-body rod protein FlgG [Phycisphaeraceae bacterium]